MSCVYESTSGLTDGFCIWSSFFQERGVCVCEYSLPFGDTTRRFNMLAAPVLPRPLLSTYNNYLNLRSTGWGGAGVWSLPVPVSLTFSYTPHNLHSYTFCQVLFCRFSGGNEFGKEFSRHTPLRSWRLLPLVEWLHQLITDAEVCRPTGPLRPVRTGGWAFLHVMRSYPN